MISEERLKELIKQEKIVYIPDTMWGEVGELKLNKTMKVIDGKVWGDIKEGLPSSCSISCAVPLTDLFETRTEATEYLKYGNVTRTEKLELPMWEQVEKFIEQMKHSGLNHSDRVLVRIITKDSIYYLKLCKDLDIFRLELKQTYIGDDLCEQICGKFPVSLGKATKENYHKALDLAIRLWKGEEL